MSALAEDLLNVLQPQPKLMPMTDTPGCSHQLPYFPVDVDQVLADAVVVSLPLTVRFRGVTRREAVLVHGPCGWGEFAPFPEYSDSESTAWWRGCVEAAWCGFPTPLRSEIPVNATVPAIDPERVPELLDSYGDGLTAIKVKVAEAGQGLEQDIARVAAVRAHCPSATVRVDANQGWTVQEAVIALCALAEYTLEYAEQPAAGIDGLYAVKEGLAAHGVDLPIAADESVRKAEDPVAVARSGAADLLVVKAAPLGGVRRALAVVRDARLPAVVSSALDTSVGLSAGVALAASLPHLPYACGLGTGALLAGDVATHPVRPRNGAVPVGLVTPDPAELTRFRVGNTRRDWWLDRIRRVHALMVADAPWSTGPRGGQ